MSKVLGVAVDKSIVVSTNLTILDDVLLDIRVSC